ncbi:NAD(P)-binding protein [Fictibacillus gelatini]|uniref:NAD(P)-binding protein n=1 Tax=Fictibacillus gelatini TaxID=225985 RepID=UPI0004217D91|nr:NAD(P)-binding protein [Fictibacillus gelatini]
MTYYPAMLDLKGKKVVIVGGGVIAERKIKGLLHSGAEITVISPSITEQVKEWVSSGKLSWENKRFDQKDCREAFLIIAATNNAGVNLRVYESAQNHQLINLVDRPDLSNFIVPSTLRRGKLSISVSTSGASPGLAKQMIETLSCIFDESYEEYMEFLDECRKHVKREIKDQHVRKKLLKELLHPRFLEMTRQGLYEEREEQFTKLIEKGRAG